jgi:hypothetical protein
MRLMLKFEIPTDDANNAAALDGSMAAGLQEILEMAQPEAAYFSILHGQRYVCLIINETDQARLMQYNEKLFQLFRAKVYYGPALTAEDLARGFE